MFKYLKIGNKLKILEKLVKTNKYKGNMKFRKYFGQLLKWTSWRKVGGFFKKMARKLSKILKNS